jgi:hypothetical protein
VIQHIKPYTSLLAPLRLGVATGVLKSEGAGSIGDEAPAAGVAWIIHKYSPHDHLQLHSQMQVVE